MMKQLKALINQTYIKVKHKHFDDNKIFNSSVKENIKRIYIVSLIEVAMHLVIAAIFIFNLYQSNIENITWGTSIVYAHLILLILSVFVFFGASYAKQHLDNKNFINVLQYGYFIMLLIAGIVIFIIDQSVTTNMTPFLVATIAVGAFFLIRPSHSLVLYLFAYVAYMVSLSMISSSPSVMLNHNTNGISMVFIGFAISLVEWNAFVINEIQKREIKKQKIKLEEMAYYDPLTEVPNRRYFDISLHKEILKDKIDHDVASIIILDLDYFKKINDTYGHPVGDFILKQVAKLLVENIRKVDIIARFGGEEFIILLPNTTLDDGYRIANKLRKLIMNKDFCIDDKHIKLTASFGIAKLEDNQNNNFYYKADQALYVAKQNGRNQVQKYVELN